jgi:glycosyltransferase involved in cell wall biosynthesis
MKLLEYMALGAVPIAPDYPPIREIIDDGQTGLVFEPRNPNRFAGSILRLAKDDSLRARLSNAAKNEVIQRRNWARNAAEILELVQKVAEIKVEKSK